MYTCGTTDVCDFNFSTSAGAGWANSTGSPSVMALRLPGEAKTSYNLPYSTYIAHLTGTYTYWQVGTFYGTDVNSGHVVVGVTNWNFTITCHGHSGRGGGCTYTYTTDNGTIVVRLTSAEITSTAISCSPNPVNVAGKATCQVTVTNGWNASNTPTGTVHISTGRLGSLSNKGTCTLVSGACTFTFHPFDNDCGSVTLTATFVGSTTFYKSAGFAVEGITGGC